MNIIPSLNIMDVILIFFSILYFVYVYENDFYIVIIHLIA